jgi:outer membrane immunogenic protein
VRDRTGWESSMKRILIAGAFALTAGGQALAADLPQPYPAPYIPPPVPVFTWTGVYLGVNGGYAFGDSNWSAPGLGSTGNFSTDGGLFGGTVGANYQWGAFVLGIEADADWANLSGSSSSVPAGCNMFACQTQSGWLATVRGRAGYAFDRVLVYGTGGAAFGDIAASSGLLPWNSTSQVGWTAGAGIEWAFLPNWTAKVEYLYVNLGSQTCNFANCGGPPTTVSLTENIVRAGVNFKFGGWGW